MKYLVLMLCLHSTVSVFCSVKNSDVQEFVLTKKKKIKKSRTQLYEEIACCAGDLIKNANHALQGTIKSLCAAHLTQDQKLLAQICKTQQKLLAMVHEIVQQESEYLQKLSLAELENFCQELIVFKEQSEAPQDASWWRMVRKKLSFS